MSERCSAYTGRMTMTMASLRRCKNKATMDWTRFDKPPLRVCAFHGNGSGLGMVTEWVGDSDVTVAMQREREDRRQAIADAQERFRQRQPAAKETRG